MRELREKEIILEDFKREKKKTETAQTELSNLNVELRSDNKSLQEELERTKRDLENLRKKQSRAETRERELNGRVERRNSTIQQLRRELKEAQSVQPRDEGEITSAAILESGKKRKAEWSDGGKDQSRGENPRDPRRKGRLETNISSNTIRAYIAVTSTCNIIRIAQSNNKGEIFYLVD